MTTLYYMLGGAGIGLLFAALFIFSYLQWMGAVKEMKKFYDILAQALREVLEELREQE